MRRKKGHGRVWLASAICLVGVMLLEPASGDSPGHDRRPSAGVETQVETRVERARALAVSPQVKLEGEALLARGRPVEVLRSTFRDFERRMRASGHDLRLDVLEVDTLPARDYQRFLWTDLVTPGTGGTLRLVRRYADAPWLEQDLLYYHLAWEDRDPSQEADVVKRQAAAKGKSVLDVIAELAVERNGTSFPVAISAYRARLSFDGRERIYRGMALWPPGTGKAFELELVDNVLPDVTEADQGEPRVVGAEEWERLVGAPPGPSTHELRESSAKARGAGSGSLEAGRFQDRLRQAFGDLSARVARSGHRLIVEPVRVELIEPADYDERRWADLVDLDGEEKLSLVALVGDAPEGEGPVVYYDLSWASVQGGGEVMDRATLMDVVAAQRSSGGDASRPVAVTAYTNLVAFEGREILYQGVAFWYGSQGEGYRFHLHDPLVGALLDVKPAGDAQVVDRETWVRLLGDDPAGRDAGPGEVP